MKTLRFICMLFAILPTALTGWTQSGGDWEKLGDEALEDRDPLGAMRYYARALAADSSRGVLNYKYAEALRANHRYAKSAYYYNKVYERDYGHLFPEAGEHLASMLKQAGKYSESKRIWRRVRDRHADHPEGDAYQKAVQEMRSCDLAMRWSEGEPPFELSRLPAPINGEDSEFAGVFDADGNLYFSSLRGEYDEEGRVLTPPSDYFTRIFVSDSTLTDINAVYPEMNGAHANYIVSDWGTVFLSFHTEGKSAIYREEDGDFIRVVPGNQADSADHTHPAPALHNGERVLYFASNRPGGFGGYDLWKLNLDDPAAKPENLGSEINTPGNEITPFYRSDEDRLYFASDRHHGFGGYDLFHSERRGQSFGRPRNLKRPYNSPANDLYYSFDPNTGRGSVTSNRTNPQSSSLGSCCNDLYSFTEEIIQQTDTTPEIETLADLNAYLPVTLYFHNDEPDPRTTSDTTHLDYAETYFQYLQLLHVYEAEYSEGLQGAEADRAERTIDNFFLEEVDGGMRDLEVFTSLLLGELEEGARIDVTVQGYASPLARTDYNIHLANRRITSLINHLKNYRSGAFLPYFENRADTGGALRVVSIPFGEYTANPVVSDNPNERDAVYGIGAARERRIQIVSVSRLATDSTWADVVFDREIIDLGRLAPGDTAQFSFEFEVRGQVAWQIDSVEVQAAGAADIQWMAPADEYEPIGTYRWSGTLTARNAPGKHAATLTLFGNLPGDMRQLNLTFEIREER